MAVDWFKADKDTVKMVEEEVAKWHQDLLDANIGIIFRSEMGRSQGKSVIGKVAKVSEKWRPLLKRDLDFVIWFAYDWWEKADDRKRRALIDHELCHCEYDERERKARLVAHDIEEFVEVFERRGFWNANLVLAEEKGLSYQPPLIRAAEQMRGSVEALEAEDVEVVMG